MCPSFDTCVNSYTYECPIFDVIDSNVGKIIAVSNIEKKNRNLMLLIINDWR
jgi:hypothetical protein